MKTLIHILIAVVALAAVALGVAIALEENHKPDYITLDTEL